jgi:hypothetical protein
VSDEHLRGWYDVARAAGWALTTPERIRAVLGACATDAVPGNDADCLNSFIKRFGERALRRPLGADDVAFYAAYYGATAGVDPPAVADVIAGLLMAPQFLYHVEHGDRAVAGQVYSLTAYELAARLSYHLWETMPDQQLWNAAASGALATPDGWAREVDRLLADPRSRKVLQRFYRQWLRVDDLPGLDSYNADPLFKAFAGLDLPTGKLRAGVIDEVVDLASHFTWDKNGGIDDLLTTDATFARSADLARIYGAPVWQGGEPPRLAPGTRPGLLTRAAFLATGSANTRPIQKGDFIRTGILCDTLPPPPNNNAPPPPELSDAMSTRQVVEALTEAKDSVCAACHRTLINPLGFALEGFDSLGRARTEQRLFSKTGREVARVPVDTRTIPQVVAGDQRPSAGPADLMRLLVDSGKAPACLARNYFRFTFGRLEDVALDGCGLERLRKSLAGNAPLRAALREVMLIPDFQQRRFN